MYITLLSVWIMLCPFKDYSRSSWQAVDSGPGHFRVVFMGGLMQPYYQGIYLQHLLNKPGLSKVSLLWPVTDHVCPCEPCNC